MSNCSSQTINKTSSFIKVSYFTWGYVLLPIGAVEAGGVVDLPLAEVDQVGVEEDADSHQDDEEPELLVGLLQGVEQGLEPGKVADKLEHPVR